MLAFEIVQYHLKFNPKLDLRSSGTFAGGVLPELSEKAAIHVKANVWLSNSLDSLVTSSQRAQIFEGRRPTILDKFQLLRHTSSEYRVAFLLDVAEHAAKDKTIRAVLTVVIGQMSYYLSTEEKVKVIQGLPRDTPRFAASPIIGQIIMNCRSRQDAIDLIARAGIRNLQSRRSRVLREVIATCHIVERLIPLTNIKLCTRRHSHPNTLQQKYEELHEGITQAIGKLTGPKLFKGTRARREFRQALVQSLRSLEEGYCCSESAKEFREVINRGILRFRIGTRYGLSLLGSKANGEVEAREWSSSDLRLLRGALARFPEGPLLFTPMVYKFSRVEQITGEAKGAPATWAPDTGVLEFTDYCFSDRPKSKDLLRRSFSYYLFHELGHGLSSMLMKSYKQVELVGKRENFLGYIFSQDFLDSSGWKIGPSGFRIVDHGAAVKIGDRKYPLGTPVEVEGKLREYHHNATYKTLYYHRGRADFPDTYSRTDPYEDWADSFADYVYRPRSLIDRSPDKFRYMEGLLHLYDGNQKIASYLAARAPLQRLLPRVEVISEKTEHHMPLRLFGRLPLLDRYQLANDMVDPGTTQNVQELISADDASLTRKFLRRLDRHPRRAKDDLMTTLVKYRPGALKALQVIERGNRVAIFADRGDSPPGTPAERAGEAQKPLREALTSFIGPDFDERLMYLLADPHKGLRLGHLTTGQRAAAILAEFARGNSVRAGGHVRSLKQSFQHVYYYDTSTSRLALIRDTLKGESFYSKISLVNMSRYSSEDIAKQLMTTVPGGSPAKIHVFALDSCLADLNSRYRVVFKETGQVIKQIKYNEFLLNPDPEYWIKTAMAMFPDYPSRSLRKKIVWDDSDFFDALRVREQVRWGMEYNRMFRLR